MSNQKNKVACITGLGQDGGYLACYLLSKNYTVYCILRRSAHRDDSLIKERGLEKVNFIDGDITDSSGIISIIDSIKPDEFYNLAAMSHVGVSFKQPSLTFEVNTIGVLNCLEGIRKHSPHTRFYQASTSELFGSAPPPQSETTPLKPNSPYAVSKLAAHELVRVYRESYGVFACAGILGNHESPYRGKDFVTRKITDWIGQYVTGKATKSLELGNLDARRDWGFAGDYVTAMHLILQQESPDDYCIGTNTAHSVREFLEAALTAADIKFYVTGSGEDTNYYNSITGERLVWINPEFYRPCEVNFLQIDFSRTRVALGWSPSMSFEELVNNMVQADINRYNRVGIHDYSTLKTYQ